MGRHLSPRYGQAILVSGYPVLTAVNWCAICVQYHFSCAPKLARKCEIERWFACGANGRLVVRSVYDHVITKFSGMGRFTYSWCSACACFARTRAPLWVWGSVPRALRARWSPAIRAVPDMSACDGLDGNPLKLFTPGWLAAWLQAKNLVATCKRIQTDILVHK